MKKNAGKVEMKSFTISCTFDVKSKVCATFSCWLPRPEENEKLCTHFLFYSKLSAKKAKSERRKKRRTIFETFAFHHNN